MSITNLSVPDMNGEVTAPSKKLILRQTVKQALEDYLLHLDGQPPIKLYDLVLKEVEAPLLEVTMKLTNNNQSNAAELLGLSRGTLRKKLKQYNLDSQ